MSTVEGSHRDTQKSSAMPTSSQSSESRQKAIVVRAVDVPAWVREAQRRVISEALARSAARDDDKH